MPEVAESARDREAPSSGAPDLAALGAITDAVEAGAGLPEILRAAARALDASLILIDRSGGVLAAAARSPADERSLMRDTADVDSIELRVAETPVGQLRMRTPRRLDGSLLRPRDDADRLRGRARPRPGTCFRGGGDELPARASAGRIADRDDLIARGKELGTELARGGTVIVVRAHPRNPTEDDWRARLLAVAARGAGRSRRARSLRRDRRHAGEVVVLVPDHDGEAGRRVRRPCCASSSPASPGSRSRSAAAHAEDPLDLHRAENEALLAANVVEGDRSDPRWPTSRPAPTSCCCRT